jgi:hypothetical protein
VNLLDPMVCGLILETGYCPSDLPGPQPHNQIGTFNEQLRRIFGPAGAPEWTGLAFVCPPALPPPAAEDLELARLLRLLAERPDAAAALSRILAAAPRRVA